MKVTDHFFIVEFFQRAGRRCPAAPYPTEWIDERLRPLCLILETLRHEFGDRPIKIISGYRSPAYNQAVKGAQQSQHLQGRAADIQVKGISAAEVYTKALALHQTSTLTIGGLGSYPSFTHIDIRPGELVTWKG